MYKRSFLAGSARLSFLAPLALAATASLPSAQLTLSPEELTSGSNTELTLEFEGCAGDFLVLLIGPQLGETEVPQIGTLGIDLATASLYNIGFIPDNGKVPLSCKVDCFSILLGNTFYIQGFAFGPEEVCGVSNVSTLNINDSLSPDSDGDGIPDVCDDCPVPLDDCDAGCWDLKDDPGGNAAAPFYGLRLDGLFGDHPNIYTFSWEEFEAGGQICYDGAGTLTIEGRAYGGLDVGHDWDPHIQGYLDVEFVYTGVKCKDGGLVVKKDGGAGYGSVTWKNTGETIHIEAKADGHLYATFDDGEFEGWLTFDGAGSGCCRDWLSTYMASSDCPPVPDCDGDGIPDSEEEDHNHNGIPDDCEPPLGDGDDDDDDDDDGDDDDDCEGGDCGDDDDDDDDDGDDGCESGDCGDDDDDDDDDDDGDDDDDDDDDDDGDDDDDDDDDDGKH